MEEPRIDGRAPGAAIPMTAETKPRVSVILPVLDEERYVRETLASILGGTFPADQMEVLVIDGNSRDRTRAIVAELAAQDPRVRLLDNPRRLTPIALNIGIRAARGDIIVRIDSHSVFPPDYVEVLVRTLESTGADMVGGCTDHVAAEDTPIARAIAYALAHPFGTGSPFRYRRQAGPVDAVVFGCWRREIFDRVGLFDERLIRNQDNEHSSRIRHSGGKLYMTDAITIQYHPRPSLKGLWKQASMNGMWNAFTERLYPYTFRWRHFLPGVFFVGVLGAGGMIVGGLLFPPLAAVGAAALAPYLLLNLGVSLSLAREHGDLGLVPHLGLVFASYHFVYGYGVTKGWLEVLTGRWKRHLGAVSSDAHGVAPQPSK